MKRFAINSILIVLFSAMLLTMAACSADEDLETGGSEVTTSEPLLSTEATTEEELETASSEPSTEAAADPTKDYGRLSLTPPSDFIIPEYDGTDVIKINENRPYFAETDLVCDEFIEFSELDLLGRCVIAIACIGKDLLPTEERGQIGMVRPSGWQTVKYDFIEGNYLYNRCHLIAYELCGANEDERNLITGTRNLNTVSMLPIENSIADYISYTGNHVCYRVTPWFEGDDLVAAGVQIEAYSIEDHGEGIYLNVFCFNVQQGVVIDYLTGESVLDEAFMAMLLAASGDHYESEEATSESGEAEDPSADTSEGSSDAKASSESTQPVMTYMLNTNTHKFHYLWCDSVNEMKEKNKQEFTGTRDEVIAMGYESCGRCNP